MPPPLYLFLGFNCTTCTSTARTGNSNNGGAKGGHSDCVRKDAAGQTIINNKTGKPIQGKCAIKGGPLATALCTGYMSLCKKCDAFYCSRHAGREREDASAGHIVDDLKRRGHDPARGCLAWACPVARGCKQRRLPLDGWPTQRWPRAIGAGRGEQGELEHDD